MNKFEKQLEKWNNGVLRGAQSKLAKSLHVSTATVALWATGQRHPSKGYIAKMAQLFKLDVYEVTRLFTTLISYPQLPRHSHTIDLHDAQDIEGTHVANTWQTHTEMTSLPVFTCLPPSFPYYAPTDAQGYWTMPVVAAQGAQYLFSLPTMTDPDQLLFIKPSNVWAKGQLMLARKKYSYQLVTVLYRNKQLILSSENARQIATAGLEPVGIVVRRLITP